MDADRFASLLRGHVTSDSRRGVLARLGAAALAAASLPARDEVADAKRRRRKKHRRTPSTPCQPNCAGKNCGDDGCGGSCGNCGIGFACQGGTCTCTCPGGQQCLSNGSCGMLCTSDANCLNGCVCSGFPPVSGGPQLCGAAGGCGDVPQRCSSTAECPAGWACQWTNCETEHPDRCVPLCGQT
jgi:hypothetical protein